MQVFTHFYLLITNKNRPNVCSYTLMDGFILKQELVNDFCLLQPTEAWFYTFPDIGLWILLIEVVVDSVLLDYICLLEKCHNL